MQFSLRTFCSRKSENKIKNLAGGLRQLPLPITIWGKLFPDAERGFQQIRNEALRSAQVCLAVERKGNQAEAVLFCIGVESSDPLRVQRKTTPGLESRNCRRFSKHVFVATGELRHSGGPPAAVERGRGGAWAVPTEFRDCTSPVPASVWVQREGATRTAESRAQALPALPSGWKTRRLAI